MQKIETLCKAIVCMPFESLLSLKLVKVYQLDIGRFNSANEYLLKDVYKNLSLDDQSFCNLSWMKEKCCKT